MKNSLPMKNLSINNLTIKLLSTYLLNGPLYFHKKYDKNSYKNSVRNLSELLMNFALLSNAYFHLQLHNFYQMGS